MGKGQFPAGSFAFGQPRKIDTGDSADRYGQFSDFTAAAEGNVAIGDALGLEIDGDGLVVVDQTAAAGGFIGVAVTPFESIYEIGPPVINEAVGLARQVAVCTWGICDAKVNGAAAVGIGAPLKANHAGTLALAAPGDDVVGVALEAVPSGTALVRVFLGAKGATA